MTDKFEKDVLQHCQIHKELPIAHIIETVLLCLRNKDTELLKTFDNIVHEFFSQPDPQNCPFFTSNTLCSNVEPEIIQNQASEPVVKIERNDEDIHIDEVIYSLSGNANDHGLPQTTDQKNREGNHLQNPPEDLLNQMELPGTLLSNRKRSRLEDLSSMWPKIESQDPEPKNEIEITFVDDDRESDEFSPEMAGRDTKTEWYCRFKGCVRGGQPFAKRKNRNDHEKFVHKKVRNYICTVCAHAFASTTALRKHMFIHTRVSDHKCKFCGKMFATNSRMVEHERCHTGEKPFECSECRKSFTKASSLYSHLKAHHQSSSNLPFECENCDEKFTTASNLKNHQIFHHNERPIICEECGKTFKSKIAIDRHRQVIHRKNEPSMFSIADKDESSMMAHD